MMAFLEALGPLGAFAISLAIGLLIGLERERRTTAKAGLRTFSLTAMAGTLLSMLAGLTQSTWLIGVGLLLLGGMMIAAYQRDEDEEDPGTTTVVAVVVCYGLGVLVWFKEAQLAITLAILTTSLLYFKTELRGVTQQLSRKDLVSILQFAVLSFVILPILPDQNYGPYAALNPYQIWWMVVLISGISLAGYTALRLVGQQHGALLTGFFGGIVSSTATTLTFARNARAASGQVPLASLVILIANGVVLFRLGILVAVLAPSLFPRLAAIFACGLLAGLVVVYLFWRRLESQPNTPELTVNNPTEIRTALTFGGLYAAVLFAAAWLSDAVGNQGLYVVALVSGLTDVDAITLSGLRLFGLGNVDAAQTSTIILLALLANNVFKATLASSIGGQALARRVVPGLAASSIGLVAGWVIL